MKRTEGESFLNGGPRIEPLKRGGSAAPDRGFLTRSGPIRTRRLKVRTRLADSTRCGLEVCDPAAPGSWRVACSFRTCLLAMNRDCSTSPGPASEAGPPPGVGSSRRGGLTQPNRRCASPNVLVLGFLALLLALILVGSARAAEDARQKEMEGFLVKLPSATLIQGSVSPSKRWAIYRVLDPNGTTASANFFASTDRKALAGYAPDLPSIASGRLDRQPTNSYQVVWNERSELVAVHDRGMKHSRLQVFWLRDGKFIEVDLPDLTRIAFPEPGPNPFLSSGQTPEAWTSTNTLQVVARVRRKGEMAEQNLLIEIRSDHSVSVTQPDPAKREQ